MEEYYLIKKSEVDFYHDLFENFKKEHKQDEIGVGARDALFGIANVLADAKLIDLSAESIDSKADNYAENFNANWSVRFISYSRALEDLKQTLNEKD